MTVLGGLLILREDAKDLVLGPLRSMLKIVARYAKNPLSQATSSYRDNISVVSDLESEFSAHLDDDDNSQEDDGFGTYETEQLITAVAKITDLLRKCWGKFSMATIFLTPQLERSSHNVNFMLLQVSLELILFLRTWLREKVLSPKFSIPPFPESLFTHYLHSLQSTALIMR